MGAIVKATFTMQVFKFSKGMLQFTDGHMRQAKLLKTWRIN
jgi:hypothetical protein